MNASILNRMCSIKYISLVFNMYKFSRYKNEINLIGYNFYENE
jgi:hypothetical protein